MIGIVDVSVQAANPSLPLFPMRAFINSPSSVRVRNVPKKIGNWTISKVYFSVAYPDNSIQTANCVLVGGVWVGTISGSTTSGFCQNGYSIFADGKDENGNEVTGYCLGKGDITILEADGQITPGETTYYVHMLSSEPSNPKEGDLWQINGSWYIYQDEQAWPIGDDSEIIGNLSACVDELKNDVDALESSLSNYATKTITQLSTETTTILPDSFSVAPYGGSVSDYRTIDSVIVWYDVNLDVPYEVSYDVNTHQLTYTEGGNYVVGIYTPEQLVQIGIAGQSIHFYDEDTGFEFDITPSPNSTEYTTTQQITKEVVYAEGGEAGLYATISANFVTQTEFQNTVGDIESILDAI